MFSLTQVANLHSPLVHLRNNGMTARAATTRRLQMGSNNRSICSRLAEREAESGKDNPNTRRINGVGVKPAIYPPPLPPGCDPSVSVIESKHVSLKLEPEPQPEPESDIFFHIRDGHYDNFSVYSVEGDDIRTCSISPAKYNIEPPSPLQKNWLFWGLSCNGLLYLRSLWNDHLLWNPTTNESKFLPPSQAVPLPPGVISDWSDYGMWYDHTCQDYKLLILVVLDLEPDDDLVYHFDLYSLRTDSWKRIPLDEFGTVGVGVRGACINGSFHTLASREGRAEYLLSFHFATETFSTSAPIPTSINGATQIRDYKGLPSLLEDSTNGQRDLWVLNNGSWMHVSTFFTWGIWMPLFFSRNGRLLYLVAKNCEVVVYDRVSLELKHSGIFLARLHYKTFKFSKSFVQLNGAVDAPEQEQRWKGHLEKVEEYEKEEEEQLMRWQA